MKYEVERLKNDLEVIFVDLPGTTATSVQIWFRAGSTLESTKDHGIAHFLEHMFFKGTPTRPGAMIAHEVESFGGEVNAFTSFDYTCYYINSPSTHLSSTVDILLDMVSNPEFKQEDLIPEREVVFEEFRRSIDSPNQYSFSQIQKSCFEGGYSHAILGNEKTIKNFTREQLTSFRNKYYNSSNSFLVVAGDISNKESIINQIEKYKLPEGKAAKKPTFSLKTKPSIEIHNKDVRMCQLSLIIQSPDIEDLYAASEDLAYNAIGHGESSPLHKELVLNDSIANNCASSTMFFSGGGMHFLRLNFPKENYKKVMKHLYTTLNDIIKNGISNEDITKIKNQYVASKIYSKESLESFSFSLGNSYAQSKDLESENKFIERIRNTSNEEVNSSFEKIFSRPIHMSLQLPQSEEASKYKKELETLQAKLAKTKVTKVKKDNSVIHSKHDAAAKLVEIKPGINLLYRHNPMTPTFVFHAYMKGGIAEETNQNNGIYNLTSSLLNKGYAGLSYEKLKLDLESKSAILGYFSGKNAYGLTLHGQTEHFQSLMKHFFGSFSTPSFSAKSLSHEKKLLLRSLDAQEEDATRNCFRIANDKLFAGHSYARNVIGSKKTITKIKRTDLVETHLKSLKNKEILFTYCGDLSLSEIKNLIDIETTSLGKRKINHKKSAVLKKMKDEVIHLQFDREQTQIFIGTQAKGMTDAQNVALKMITTHLSGQSSELFVDVRDKKGLCYVAQPIHMNALEAGYWGIYMASGHDKVEEAVAAIKEIIERTKKEGISKADFERIKKMIEGQNQLNLQTNEDYANTYSIPALHGHGIDYFYKANTEIANLKYDDFQKFLKKALSGSWITVTVGR